MNSQLSPESRHEEGDTSRPTNVVSAEPALEVRNLRVSYRLRGGRVDAVNGVSFKVNFGECLGVVGESGSGKSTVGFALMGLLPRSARVLADQVMLEGSDISRLGRRDMRALRGNKMSMVYQDPMTSLNPTVSIGKQIVEGIRVHEKTSAPTAKARALEILDLVGVPNPRERFNAFPHQLSGGLRQRVLIAMALVRRPSLLIADEPTTGLDVTIQAQILDLLDDLRAQLNMAVVLITHDMGVIAERADRVMVMYAGEVVERASTRELFAAMRHPYTQALLESVPRLDADRRRPLPIIPGRPPDLSEEILGCPFRPRCAHAIERCERDNPELEGPSQHQWACFAPVSGPASHPDPAAPSQDVGDTPADAAETDGSHGENSDAPALLEVKNVVKNFAVGASIPFVRNTRVLHAVSDVTLKIGRGESFGLVGESGSGKTTLGRIITGFETPTSGSVVFAGEEMTALRGRAKRRSRRDLQLMFQDPYSSLDPRIRIGETVREPLTIQRMGSRTNRRARVASLLEEVGLSTRILDSYPHELSGGQRQRVGLARVLILEPGLIVTDEPVSALDVSVQSQVLNLMKTVQRERDLSLLVISHDLAVVKFLADRIGVMYLGKLVEVGPVDDVYASPAHHYTRALIDAIPNPDPVRTEITKMTKLRGELPSAVDPPSGCRFRTRCPAAAAICATEVPPLRSFGPGHLAACHLPLRAPD